MIKGIVVTHGRLAEELLATARQVFGEFSHCYAISNEQKTPQALCDEIVAAMDSDEESPAIILVDFFGGSCSHACMMIETIRDDACVICGVNLPMLLAFLNKRDEVPFEDLPKEILERGRNSIKILDPTNL